MPVPTITTDRPVSAYESWLIEQSWSAPYPSTGITFTDFFCGFGGSSIGLTEAGLQLVWAANHWIAQLDTEYGENIATGACGEENETTIVSIPKVVTHATAASMTGTMAHDTAVVDGMAPHGATLVFRAYVHGDEDMAAGGRGQLVCETTASPVAVDAGMNTGREYDSPECRMLASAAMVFWVEQLLARDGTALHEGLYGVQAESTHVSIPPRTPRLPVTGLDDATTDLIALGAIAIVIVGTVLVLLRRVRIRRH